MYNKNKDKLRPLTKPMIEILMECHERELMNLSPYAATNKGIKGLICRKMVNTSFFTDENGKRFMGIILTGKGKVYLETMQ